jgi:hypothetical protein
MVRLEELGQLKNPITSSGIESAIFRLVTMPQATTIPRAPDNDFRRNLLPPKDIYLPNCMPYDYTLKMEAVGVSEKVVSIYMTSQPTRP